MRLHSRALSVLALFAAPSLYAQGIATETQLKPVTVTDTRAPLDRNLPNSTDSRTRAELESQNVFNAEDTLRYLPSTTVRKRYFGDRNGLVGGRSHGVTDPGRSLVYLDGYLISALLGRFDAPRWQMVNSEAIERVDILYGPFSAIYPGNSMGTTVVITERKPKGFEGSASIKYNHHSFKEYSTDDTYKGTMLSARLASRTDNGFWWNLGFQKQDVTGHPQGYANTVGTAAGQFGAANAGTRVNGILRDTDPNGARRALFATNGIDRTKQDSINARLGYEISPAQEIEGRISWWRNDSTVRVENYLTNAATGAPVWSGTVNDGVNSFNLNSLSAQFAPSKRDESNRQLGITWKTKHATGWNASVVATQYSVLNDVNRTTSLIQPTADNGGVGLAARRDGTGWNTFEVQSTYTPTQGDFGDGKHSLVFGLHRNAYTLKNTVRDASDWRGTETSLNQSYQGNTQILALYAQDAWKIRPDLTLTTGLRHERYKQTDGQQFDKSVPLANQNVSYADRSLSATSPKLSLAWAARDDVLLRASLGKGVRFPNVDEMFNGTRTSTSILINNPNLRPEKSQAMELTAEKFWDSANLRATLFRDNVKDAILRQTDTSITPSTQRSTNVERVLSNGIEVVWQLRDLGIKGFDFSGSSTWVDAKIKENSLAPATVGKNWIRIPKQRHTLQASYRPNAQWTFGANYRFAGRQWNTAANTDINQEVFGGLSKVNQLDVSARWKFAKEWEWAFGIDNLNNSSSWQAHTFPQRSFQTELRYAFK